MVSIRKGDETDRCDRTDSQEHWDCVLSGVYSSPVQPNSKNKLQLKH